MSVSVWYASSDCVVPSTPCRLRTRPCNAISSPACSP
jgi:hypothetical protein